ncbi:MAG: hypothetical protein HYV68_00215 [Candidatus Taylorbacteria bacterium]|nr:hypothetical protein [Candidatus Taylorbacteria bacterium]
MLQRYQNGDLTWVDLVSPSSEEIRQVVAEFSIHPMAARELTIPTLRPKVDLYENFVYLILHFPSIERSGDGMSDQEIDFIIGKDFIVTARYGEVDALFAFSKAFEVENILDRGAIGKHAGYIFFAMLTKIYETLLHRIEGLKNKAAGIEAEIFKGKEREMVIKISELSRYLLDFKRATSLHKEILDGFMEASSSFYGKEFEYFVQKLLDDYYRVERSIANIAEFIAELRETNDSLLVTKQNQVTQFLTVLAFIALPLSIMTSFLQIDFKSRPIVGIEGDFWILIAFEAGIALMLYLFFKWKKWL